METTDLQYPNEEKFKSDLVNYLQEHGLVDEMLPNAPDIEEKWQGIAEAYLPDGIKEFSAYPTVSLGWMMYVRNRIDYDHMDDYICEKVLLLSAEDHQQLTTIVGECAARTNNLLHHLGLAPGSPEAFHSYVAALHQLYYMGAAVQLKRMGYHMRKM